MPQSIYVGTFTGAGLADNMGLTWADITGNMGFTGADHAYSMGLTGRIL